MSLAPQMETDASRDRPQSAEPTSLSGVLEDLERCGHDDAVSVGDVLDAFAHRSLGFLITVFALIAAIPVIGAIPGVSILTGSLILIAIFQSVAGGKALWAPGFVRRREIDRDTYRNGLERGRRWLGRIDRVLKPRLRPLVATAPARAILIASAAAMAVTFYPLAFVPWGVTVPALGALAVGLALLSGDGLLALVGYLLGGSTVAALVILL